MKRTPLVELMEYKPFGIVDKHTRTLSTESGFISNIITSVTGKEETLFTKISKSLLGVTNVTANITEWLSDQAIDMDTPKLINTIELNNARVEKQVEGVKFSKIENIMIPTIPGLNNRLYYLSIILSSRLTDLATESVNNLKSIDKEISLFISSEDARKSFRDLDPKLVKMDKMTASIMDELKGLFDMTDPAEEKPFKDVFGSVNEYKTVLANASKTNDNFPVGKLKDIYDVSVKLSKRLGVLHDALQNDEFNVSKVSLDNMIRTTDIAAKYVTIISTLYYTHVKTMQILTYVKNNALKK